MAHKLLSPNIFVQLSSCIKEKCQADEDAELSKTYVR